jgi:hypothetical protein
MDKLHHGQYPLASKRVLQHRTLSLCGVHDKDLIVVGKEVGGLERYEKLQCKDYLVLSTIVPIEVTIYRTVLICSNHKSNNLELNLVVLKEASSILAVSNTNETFK